MISRLLLGLGSFSNSMLYTFIFIFFTYQLIEPQLIYTIFSEYATILLYFWKYLHKSEEYTVNVVVNIRLKIAGQKKKNPQSVFTVLWVLKSAHI